MLNSADVTSGADNIVYRLENYSANIGLIQVKEEGWTGFSEGWQGCSEGFPEGEARGKSRGHFGDISDFFQILMFEEA